MTGLLDRARRLLGLAPAGDPWGYVANAAHGMMVRARAPERWVPTTCGYCSVGCGIHLGVREGRAVALRGDPSHPVNRGALCPKGLTAHHTIHAEGRALTPMMRAGKGRPLEPASWDAALDRFVGQVGELTAAHGDGAFAIVSTGQLVTEEFYALGKLARLGFRSRHYDGNTTLCMATAVSGYKQVFGSDGPPGCYDDLSQAECVVLIGANVADNHPILLTHLMRNPGCTIVTIDPRVTKTAMLADHHLAIRPRTDVALLNGILACLIEEDRLDHRFIEDHTEGFAEVVERLRGWSAERAARETGIAVGTIREVARVIGTARSTVFAWTMGVNHSTQGTETVQTICTLAALTGNIGRVGGSPFSITGQCNAMGSREASCTSSLPGYRSYESESDRAELAGLWNVAASELPTARGHAYPDIIDAIRAGQVKALWIIATNPVVSFPNRELLLDAFAHLDLLVVQDSFFPTPTAELADLVLPAAMWGEKEGTYTNSERRVSKVNAAVSPPGEARTDLDIFFALAERLGVRDKLYPGWSGPRDAFEEWRRVSAGRLCDYAGIDYERLASEGPQQWPRRDGASASGARLYEDGVVPTPSGRVRLHVAAENQAPPEAIRDAFPFTLNTGRTVEHWHTRTKTGRVATLEAKVPEAWLEINPRDAHVLGIRAHDRVRVVTQRGQVEGVRARIASTVAPSQVFLPFHFVEHNANALTLADVDPISREPNYKQCAARVERM